MMIHDWRLLALAYPCPMSFSTKLNSSNFFDDNLWFVSMWLRMHTLLCFASVNTAFLCCLWQYFCLMVGDALNALLSLIIPSSAGYGGCYMNLFTNFVCICFSRLSYIIQFIVASLGKERSEQSIFCISKLSLFLI